MTNKEIEKKIGKAFSNAVPQVFDEVLRKCEKEKPTPQTVENKSYKVIGLKKILSVAAMIAIIFTSGLAGFGIANLDKVDSIISFDVNPSIELKVNRKEKIIDATALNEDAQKVLGKMDLKGSDLTVAVNAIIGSMLRNGYIDELSNSILISVDNKNEKRSASLEKRLFNEISEILVDGAVISQTLKKNEKIIKLAEEYGITRGKAQLILQITADNSKYKFKDLAPLTINDLNLIASGEKVKITSSGKASEKQYIGKAKAKKIALSADKVSENDISDYKAGLKYKSGKMVYEIEFKTETAEYEYIINATNGKIIKEEIERKGQEEPLTPTLTQPTVDENTAKASVLALAGVGEQDISNYICLIDYNGEAPYYNMSFTVGEVLYVYNVDATTGEITTVQNGNPQEEVTSETPSEPQEIPSSDTDISSITESTAQSETEQTQSQ